MATIQVIDDDVVLLARLAAQLEQEGHTVLKISAAPQAEAMFIEHQPDLVLLEVRLNQGQGWQLLERFSHTTPVIVLSSDGHEEDIVRGFDCGAVDYIPKPYRAKELIARIHQRVNGKGKTPLPPTSSPTPEPPHSAAPAPPSETPELPKSPKLPERRPKAEDDSIFISDIDEIALMRSYADTTSAEPLQPADTPNTDSPGDRLKEARRKKNLTLVQVENDLHIRMSYLQAMEEEKFSMLPRGAMAVQMIRTYASYLEMDIERVVEDYQQLYVTHTTDHSFTEAARKSMPSVALGAPPKWVLWIVAVILALLVSGAGIYWVDPQGFRAMGQNVIHMVVSPTPTSTATPQPTPSKTPPPATLSPVVRTTPTTDTNAITSTRETGEMSATMTVTMTVSPTVERSPTSEQEDEPRTRQPLSSPTGTTPTVMDSATATPLPAGEPIDVPTPQPNIPPVDAPTEPAPEPPVEQPAQPTEPAPEPPAEQPAQPAEPAPEPPAEQPAQPAEPAPEPPAEQPAQPAEPAPEPPVPIVPPDEGDGGWTNGN